jgi:hypothetical protein
MGDGHPVRRIDGPCQDSYDRKDGRSVADRAIGDLLPLRYVVKLEHKWTAVMALASRRTMVRGWVRPFE